MIICATSAVALRLISVLAATILTAVLAVPSLAEFAPTTPTFQLKWGNSGTAPSQFNTPSGMATDALGNVYVADQLNHRVQKFDRFGNLIAQWGSSGAGPGQFNQAFGVAIDAAGNVYVSDNGNHRIQKFTSSGSFVTQWGTLGTGNGQLNGPLGVAVDAAGNVYVADQFNHRIQKFTSAGLFVTKWGSLGAANGQFNTPSGVAIDAAGNVYVADNSNHRIQKFTSAGVHLATWGGLGTGDGQFNAPLSVAVDAVGNVYVTDRVNSRIQKFTSVGVFITKWGTLGAGDGQFDNPIGVTVDAAGNVYISEQTNHRIQKFSGAGVPLVYAAPSYLTQWGSSGSGNGQFNFPHGVAVDASGNVYIADRLNHRIQKFSSIGTYLTQWGSAGGGDGQFNQPSGVAVDAFGNVYVADNFNGRIQKFSSTGTYLTKWFAYAPQGVATDAFGNVYVSTLGDPRVQKFSSTGTLLAQWFAFANPIDVATDAFGNGYVADYSSDWIRRFSGTGTYLTWGSPGSGNGQFKQPSGVAVDAFGNVYVADSENHRIQKFSSTGTYLTQWGSLGGGNGQFDRPYDVAMDAFGNVYVTEVNNNRIQKFASPPHLALVSDVGNDQGKQVQLRVVRCSADAPGAGVTITGYEIYRRNDPLSVGSTIESGAEPAAVQLSGWTYLGSFPAHGESEYTVVVPTLANASASSLYYTAFMVRAVTADSLTFYDSAVEYGYSVDNLSPPAPTQFMAAYAAGATHLHWAVSTATDFASFKLYRGPSSGFTPGADNLVTTTTDTGYADTSPAGSWYKISAVDIEGNESPFAVLGPGQTTDVPGDAPLVFALDGVRPNPASSRALRVYFALPAPGPARLDLLDVAGRRVTGREVGSLGAGAHMVDLAEGSRIRPGLYFVRLLQGANQKIVRVMVLE